MKIVLDDLTRVETRALITSHLTQMASQSPPESKHALGLEKLQQSDITVWSAWEGDEILGCGALKELEREHGEIKSMKTAPEHVRKGVARSILQEIVNEAIRRGYTRVSLETGSMKAFEPAHKLYERFGFTYCEPFGSYTNDPNSLFMTKSLKAEKK